MSNIEIKHLFKYSRFPDGDVGILLFILYIPIGVVLFTLRLIVLLCAALVGHILPDTPPCRKYINKIICMALGITVTIENPKAKENVSVFVSNHLSIFDHVAVQNVTGAIMPIKTALENFIGLNSYNFGSLSNFERFREKVQKFILDKKSPVYFLPEEKPTNGKSLLKFKTYPFQLSMKVQPVCIKIDRPFLNIGVTIFGSSYYYDALYFMLCPVTNYKIRFLESVEKRCLTDEEFSAAVRQRMASCLKIELVDYTANDVAEWEKRKLTERQQRSQNYQFARREARPVNPDIQRMTLQIKEVLPHVPYNVIYNDLCSTENVDNTITNLLEGRVRFTAEPIPSTSKDSSPSTSSSLPESNPAVSKYSLNTAAPVFPKSAAERNKSFQERKEQLIANARRCYIEKHNLDIPF